jgi:hypothetical protein
MRSSWIFLNLRRNLAQKDEQEWYSRGIKAWLSHIYPPNI